MEHLLAATNKVVELNNQLTAVTEQRDGLHELHNKNAARSKELLELCGTLRKQRDRLAEALKKAAPIVSRYPSGWDFSHDELDEADDEITEALQSLNQSKPESKDPHRFCRGGGGNNFHCGCKYDG